MLFPSLFLLTVSYSYSFLFFTTLLFFFLVLSFFLLMPPGGPWGHQSDAERLLFLQFGGGWIIHHPTHSMVALQARKGRMDYAAISFSLFCESEGFTGFISWSGGWIRLLILIPGVVSLSALFIGYRRIQCIVLMAAPSLRGRCVDFHLNDGMFRIVL